MHDISNQGEIQPLSSSPPPAGPVPMRIDGFISEGQTLDIHGHAVHVTVIQGGVSKNGFLYTEAVLRSITRLIEGAHAYADHARSAADQQARSVRDIVGFYHDARYVPSAPGSGFGRVDATLHILESAAWLWSLLYESCSLGRPELIGLSIDIFGRWQPTQEGSVKEVLEVAALNSCDIVTRPGAGGTFRRLLHHDQTVFLSTTSIVPSHPATGGSPTMSNSSSETSTSPIQPSMTCPEQLTEQEARFNSLLHDLELERAQMLLERRLLESVLPDPVKALVRSRFAGRLFAQEDLDADLKAQQEMLAALAASGTVRGYSYEKPRVGQMISEAEKIQAAFDGMFDLDIDASRVGPVRPFTSIREAYARVTGDPGVHGFSSRSALGEIQISEHAPLLRISETDTTTASFSYLLGTSMNKRLLRDYQAWPAEWSRFVSIVPIRDFKQQSRVRLGAFGSLSVVAEDSAYTAVSLTDSAATYTPQKRGNLVTISRETIVNDDLQAIKQIPTKLAVSAAYTLAEFVYGFLSSNPTIYDGSNLFTSGAPHANLGAAALSTSAVQSGVTAMREQSNYAGKRLGLRPRYLIVPAELEWTSMVITQSAHLPGGNNNDINPMLGYVTPIVSPQLTSTTQWFLVADPREVDTIEIGFVGGQVNPSLFVQDSPLVGLHFTQDAISYKIRHEYGGAVVDFRGLYRGI